MRHVRYVLGCTTIAALLPAVAFAQVVISEIAYDIEGTDSGREWIEVFNTGSSAVALTEWKLFEAETNHGLTAYAGGELLAGNTYAVVADNPTKFLEDYPGFSGVLFDSAFSLSNAGETLVLRCCGSGGDLLDKDSVTYSPDAGGAGDGKTLHRVNTSGTSFAAGLPTPGEGQIQGTGSDNSRVISEDDETTSSNASGDSTTPAASASLTRVNAGSDRGVIVNTDTNFEAKAYNAGNQVVEAQFRWSFGDGTTALGQRVVHRWEYPGRYIVVVEALRFGETVSRRITVSVEVPKLTFEVLSDGGVIIENLSSRELDFSGWRIAGRGMTFSFPSNTIVLRGASIRLSPNLMGFHASSGAVITYPSGEIAADANTQGDTEADAEATPAAPGVSTALPEGLLVTTNEQIDANDVSSVVEDDTDDAGVVEEVLESSDTELLPERIANTAAAASTNFNTSFLWWTIALLTLLLGAVAVFLGRYVQRKKSDREEDLGEWNIIEDTGERV